MAQLKDTVVSGNLRVTDTAFTNTAQVTTIKAPTSSGGSTYGPGTSGQVLKSNGTSVYWGGDSNTYTSAHCTTAAGTAAKTASCSNYVLLSKSWLHVLIATANTSASALTLNVNGAGAKPIYINGTASSSSNYTLPAGTYLVYYDGTNYYFRTDGALTGNSGNVTGSGLTADTIILGNGNSAIKTSSKTIATSISDVDTSVPTSKAVKTFVEGKGYTTNTGTVIGSSLTADTIITGNGGVNVKTSSKTIATSITNVDTTVPTSKAVKTYVDGLVANATHFKGGFAASGDGTIDGGSTTLKSVAEAIGDMYTCTTAGTIYGIAFEVGDSIIFKKVVAAGTAPVSTDLITVEGETSVSVVVPSSSSVTWNTEKTIATVEGTEIKLTIPSNPVPSNNVTGSGTSGCIAKWSGTNTVTNGPQFGSDTTKYLRNDGSWTVPPDTKNTAGSTDTSSKIFLIGATSQAANPQTYSHDTAYVGTDGHMYSNSKQVVNLSDSQALTNKTYNGYTLAAACAKSVTDNSTSTAVTSSDTNLITGRTLYYAGYAKVSFDTANEMMIFT